MDNYKHESLMWVRSLEFFKQENNYLKNRLSEVVDKTTNKYFLAEAEHFQNQFIIKDEFIDELKHDVNELNRQIINQTMLVNGSPTEIEEKYTCGDSMRVVDYCPLHSNRGGKVRSRSSCPKYNTSGLAVPRPCGMSNCTAGRRSRAPSHSFARLFKS